MRGCCGRLRLGGCLRLRFGFRLGFGCGLGVGLLLRGLRVVHLLDGGVELRLGVGVGLRVGHILLADGLVRLVDGLREAVAGGIVRHLPLRVLEGPARAVNTLLELRLGGVQLLRQLAVPDGLERGIKRPRLGIGLVRVRGIGSLGGSELPRQPFARMVLGDALERLRLPDGVVELVQQLRVLELIRLVCGGGGLVHRLRERLVGRFRLRDRLMVGVGLPMCVVGVAAANTRQHNDDGGDDDGGEFLVVALRLLSLLGFVLLGHFRSFSPKIL